MLDAIPEGLEPVTFQHRFTGADRNPFIRILDIKLAGQLAEDVLDPRFLFGKSFREFQSVFFERGA